MEYKYEITRMVKYEVTVEAESEEEAIDKAHDAFLKDEVKHVASSISFDLKDEE